MALKVEKGVPLPNHSRQGEFNDVIATMKAGDSVRFGKKDEAERFRQALIYQSKGTDFGTALRTEGNGFRVWRTDQKAKRRPPGKKK